ncbi:MAG TPA: TIGR01440 family protein [Firmicutes bacterium]|nr:TIGR01440 family protein [Bacillota bacterium]
MLGEIQKQAKQAAESLLAVAKAGPGDIMVIGCSTSEVGGHKIGSFSSMELAGALFAGIYPVLQEKGVFLAAQCCEHLNRCIVLERAAAEQYRLVPVNAVPQPKAGGSFATTAYQAFQSPVVVEAVQAKCGMDIGGTLIGMHLMPVAVPVRLEPSRIGQANIIFARSRPKFIGGIRARYDENLL